MADEFTLDDTPLTTLKAQGGKYTPDQMAQFDKRRGELLRDEYNAPGADITNIAKEVSFAKPATKAGFNSKPDEFTLDDKEFSLDDNEFTLDHPTRSFQQDITGGLAAVEDMAGGLVGAAVGGVHGLGTLATGGGLKKAVQNIEDTSSKFLLGPQLQDEGTKAAYAEANKPLEYLLDKAHEAGGYVAEKSGSPLLGTIANVGLQIGTPLLAGKALGATVRVRPRERIPEVSRGTRVVDDIVNEHTPKGEEPNIHNPDDPIYVDKYGAATDASNLDAMNKARAEFEERQRSNIPPEPSQLALDLDEKPVVNPEIGEITEKPKLRKGQGKDLFGRENLDRADVEAEQVKNEQIDRAFDENHPARDELATQFEKAKEQRTQQEAASDPYATDVDAYQPEQQSPNQTPMKLGQKKRYNKQGGAVNFGAFTDNERRVKDLNDNLQFIDRRRNDIKAGDTVRLMNGKTGVVQSVAEGRYSIVGKDFKDSVPIQAIDYRYKPQGNAAENYKKAGQLAIGRKERGALNLKDLFGKRATSDIKYDDATNRDLIAKALEQSRSPEEFHTNLRLSISDPDITSRSGDLWNVKDSFLEKHGPSQYSKLPELTRRQTADVTRTFPKMLTESKIEEPLKQSEDIGMVSRFGNVGSIQSLYQKGKAGAALKWVISNTQETINQSLKLFKELQTHFEDYRDSGRTSQAKITRTQIGFDGLRNNKLRDLGLQWPTREMLAEEGLSPKEIGVYEKVTKGLDQAYDKAAEAIRADGKEPPPRIPGWFPHQWLGSYKVILKDAEGRDFHLETFSNRYRAKRFMAKARYDFEARLEEPSWELKDNQIASTIIQALEVFKNRGALDKAVLAKLNRLDQWNQRGVITQILEREANVTGHEASKGLSDSIWDSKHNSRLESAYLKYTEDLSKFWANSKIARDVSAPFNASRELFANTPNLTKAIEEQIGRATGHTVNHLKVIDESARALATYAGVAPTIVADSMGALSRLMQFMKLIFPNPAYILVNSFQALTGLDAIARIHAERAAAGLPTASYIKSTGVLLREMLSVKMQGKWSPEYQQALKWLKDNNKIDTYQIDMVDPTQGFNVYETVKRNVLTKIPTAIEEHNRTAMALSLYSYFREVMPVREALEASAIHMDTVMGNYTPGQSAGMFTDMGAVGKGMRPFHILPNTYLGRLALNVSLPFNTIKDAMAGKVSATKIPATLAPFAVMSAMFYMTSGINGMFGFQEWDSIARTFNQWVDPDNELPRSADLARRWGASTPSIYGLLGSFLGANIGPSMNAPAANDVGAMPWLDMATAIFQTIGVGLNVAAGNPPNMEKLYKAGRTALPPLAIAQMEDFIARKNKGMYPATNQLAGEYKRSPEEIQLTDITGKRSIKEQNQRDLNSLEKYYSNTDRRWKEEQMDKLYQIITKINPSSTDPVEFAQKMINTKRGFDGDDIVNGVIDRIDKGQTSAEDRNLLKIAGTKNAAEMQRRVEILKRLHHMFKSQGH
jgi:hypothetical protein